MNENIHFCYYIYLIKKVYKKHILKNTVKLRSIKLKSNNVITLLKIKLKFVKRLNDLDFIFQ